MARNYKKFMRGEGVFVPRWVVTLLIIGLLTWFGLKILIPPTWIIQRLDSPDGLHKARLLRSRYLRENFVVEVKDRLFWRTVFYSPPITNDYRVDLNERLVWTEDARSVNSRS